MDGRVSLLSLDGLSLNSIAPALVSFPQHVEPQYLVVRIVSGVPLLVCACAGFFSWAVDLAMQCRCKFSELIPPQHTLLHGSCDEQLLPPQRLDVFRHPSRPTVLCVLILRRTQYDGFLGSFDEYIAQKHDRFPPGLFVLAGNTVLFARDDVSPCLKGIFVRRTNGYDNMV